MAGSFEIVPGTTAHLDSVMSLCELAPSVSVLSERPPASAMPGCQLHCCKLSLAQPTETREVRVRPSFRR